MHIVRSLIVMISLGLASGAAIGKPAAKPRGQKKATPDMALDYVKSRYRTGEMKSGPTWERLAELSKIESQLSREGQAELYQLQGHLLLRADYPVAAAVYVSEALKRTAKPLDDRYSRAWAILASVSRARPIQYIIEDLAQSIKLEQLPPYFKTDWHYFVANALLEQGRTADAEASFRRLTMGDRYFLPGQFQIAILRLNEKDDEKAEAALKTMLSQSALEISPIKERDKRELINYAHMALGRLYYQKQQFLESVRQYRLVEKTSNLYYDALFEQSWSLFMGGNPQHALGMLYGVTSPFFAERFNPEAKVLEAIIYYWMCRYQDSRNSLADFAEAHGEAVESLRVFLDRQQLRPETAYQLFEDLVSGVSAGALGIPRNVLMTAAERDSMLLARDQFATLTGERSSLDGLGVFKSRAGLEAVLGRLDRLLAEVKKNLGAHFLEELRSLKDQYDELYSQSQFLYLELLMSEKEQLLGRELHGDTKVTNLLTQNIRAWARESQAWREEKNEYWWDEIGYHVIQSDPMCKVN